VFSTSFVEWMACIRPITPVLFVGFCNGPCALARVDESRMDAAMTERTRMRALLWWLSTPWLVVPWDNTTSDREGEDGRGSSTRALGAAEIQRLRRRRVPVAIRYVVVVPELCPRCGDGDAGVFILKGGGFSLVP